MRSIILIILAQSDKLGSCSMEFVISLSQIMQSALPD